MLLVNLGGNPTPRTFSSSHLIFEEYLKEKQYRESTIETKRKLVGFLRKRVNLWDSEAVRDFIKKHPWGGKRKNNAQYAYRNWCQWKDFEYEYDKFREERIHRVEIIDEYKNQVCRYGNIMYCIECLENDPNQYKLCERETHLLCREDITDAIIS